MKIYNCQTARSTRIIVNSNVVTPLVIMAFICNYETNLLSTSFMDASCLIERTLLCVQRVQKSCHDQLVRTDIPQRNKIGWNNPKL